MNLDKVIKVIKKEIGDFKPEIALIFGSGLSDACPDINIFKELDYSKIGLPKSTVKGHSDRLIFGEYKGKKIVKIGRFHYNESGDVKMVNIPFYILNGLGVDSVILATATGGVSDFSQMGDIFVVKDHINFTPNPLIGIKGKKFLSMDNAYDKDYISRIKLIAINENIELKEGIHAQMSGPSYETLAEVNMLKILGADTCSMSTAQDVILCKFYGIKVLCFAVVCNKAGEKTSHEEVLESSKKIGKKLKNLVSKFIESK